MNMIEVLRSKDTYDLDTLRKEVSLVRSIQDFGGSRYSHAISLPRKQDIERKYRTHVNNVPFSATLGHCPFLLNIFKYFLTPKVSYRLLRRAPRSAYALHDDRDMGKRVVRFQIPVTTNRDAHLFLLKDDVSVGSVTRAVTELQRKSDGNLSFSYQKLYQVFGDDFELFYLEPGYLYYFDTDKLHTLINAGLDERITLSIDLVENDWLKTWMPEYLRVAVKPVSMTELPATRWDWNSLRHGVISNP